MILHETCSGICSETWSSSSTVTFSSIAESLKLPSQWISGEKKKENKGGKPEEGERFKGSKQIARNKIEVYRSTQKGKKKQKALAKQNLTDAHSREIKGT